MIRFAWIALVVVTSPVSLRAQQLEVNDATGSMTSLGREPVVGSPFPTQTSGTLYIEVGGSPGSPFVLLLGALATTSFCDPILGGECVDLEMGTAPIPLTAVIINRPLGVIGSTGTTDFAFAATAFDGLTPAFQAIVTDPTTPPLNLNFTAAVAFDVAQDVVLRGDDVIGEFVFPNGPRTYYGRSYTNMTVSTNGWIKLGDGCTFSDLAESSTDFASGTIGGAPGGDAIVAALWDDLDVGNDPSQLVRISYVGTDIFGNLIDRITVRWENADYYPMTPIGTIEAQLCADGRVRIGYPALSIAHPTPSGLVGLSSGEDIGGTTVIGHDLVVGGQINPLNPSAFRTTIFEDFNVTTRIDVQDVLPISYLTFVPTNAFGGYEYTQSSVNNVCN